jgi:hypothetical protein
MAKMSLVLGDAQRPLAGSKATERGRGRAGDRTRRSSEVTGVVGAGASALAFPRG